MKNLRLLREKAKLSQQKLADQLDLAQSQIQSYETGAYEPDIATLMRLADLFDTTIDYLVGRTKEHRAIEPVAEYALNAAEQKLVDSYRRLTKRKRQSLLVLLEGEG
ncbi:MAG: helix-turn-helix domain-containing protein [Clostridium sp.]|jgi:transcriptional regulator with XRE-family HTH domain|nr:helix-turn-helix domain-containing protein [Clostridium sp.]